jgi:SWI/SNF-related matrix-associated actin-dependent regulator of chromatin subfamily A member 5
MRRRLSKKAYLADKVIEGPGNDVYSPVSLNAADNEEISSRPSEVIFPSTFNAHMLENSDLQSIMNSCVLEEPAAQKLSPAEERAWLRRSECVRTNIFNGQKVDTSRRGYSMYKETILDVSTAVRRIGRRRTMTIRKVSKESIEAASSMSPPFPKAKPKAKTGKLNETVSCPYR